MPTIRRNDVFKAPFIQRLIEAHLSPAYPRPKKIFLPSVLSRYLTNRYLCSHRSSLGRSIWRCPVVAATLQTRKRNTFSSSAFSASRLKESISCTVVACSIPQLRAIPAKSVFPAVALGSLMRVLLYTSLSNTKTARLERLKLPKVGRLYRERSRLPSDSNTITFRWGKTNARPTPIPKAAPMEATNKLPSWWHRCPHSTRCPLREPITSWPVINGAKNSKHSDRFMP